MNRWHIILSLIILPVICCFATEKITIFADFENGLEDWTTEGSAFGVTAAPDEFYRKGHGQYFADSRYGNESATGVLRSPVFKCPDEIRFLANGWDLRDGNGGRNFFRLRKTDGTIIAQCRPPLCTGDFVEIRWQVWPNKDEDVRFEVVDNAADGAFAWLAVDYIQLIDLGPLVREQDSDLYAIGATSDAPVTEGAGMAFKIWQGPPVYDNSQHVIPLGIKAQEIYLLGCTSTLDQGCPSWPEHHDFTRDFTRQQMIGDHAGDLKIEYADGTQTTIPLIFGFTLWWDIPWRNNKEPMASDPEAAITFATSCRLKEVPFIDGGTRFVMAIACEDKPVKQVVFVDSSKKAGCPAFWGMSVRTDAPAAGMSRMTHHQYDEQWLNKNLIDASLIPDNGYQSALTALKQMIGMTDADLPERVRRDVPKGFKGPGFRLTGGVFADILTNAYYHTVDAAGTRSIREDGFIYCAPPNMPDYNAYNSIGTFAVISRGAGSSWTRGYEYLRDLAAWGYNTELTKAIDWTDTCLDFYPKHCPARVQWQGKEIPWPAHWATTADHPESGIEPGNNEIPGDENDGHALTMMLRYAQWRALGRDMDWLKPRWERAVSTAEWLCFVLDYTKQDVLYNESEGTCYGAGFNRNIPGGYDIYPHYEVFTNTLGLLALRQYTEMASTMKDLEHAKKWNQYADRIEEAMVKRCTIDDPVYGKVWRIHPNSIWPQFDERLAPVFELPYFQGFDCSYMNREWLEISQNSLRMQIGNPADYHHGLGLGYGQGWITPAALLLDEMTTAKPLLDNLARYMYFPKHLYPFTGIEGIVVNEDGDFRVRNGTIGIDEGLFVTRVWRVMMGVDDTQPGVLSLMPRVPEGYPDMWVAKHPFSVATGGQEVTGKVTYAQQRKENSLRLRVNADCDIPELQARLGPFKDEPVGWSLSVGGILRDFKAIQSGDSWWVWVSLGENVRQAECMLMK